MQRQAVSASLGVLTAHLLLVPLPRWEATSCFFLALSHADGTAGWTSARGETARSLRCEPVPLAKGEQHGTACWACAPVQFHLGDELERRHINTSSKHAVGRQRHRARCWLTGGPRCQQGRAGCGVHRSHRCLLVFLSWAVNPLDQQQSGPGEASRSVAPMRKV